MYEEEDLAGLPTFYADLIRMTYDGTTDEGIADALGVTVDQVHNLRTVAYHKLANLGVQVKARPERS